MYDFNLSQHKSFLCFLLSAEISVLDSKEARNLTSNLTYQNGTFIEYIFLIRYVRKFNSLFEDLVIAGLLSIKNLGVSGTWDNCAVSESR